MQCNTIQPQQAPIKEVYKGFTLIVSNRSGKATQGNAKTKTVQVRDHSGCQRGYFLRKQIRFTPGQPFSFFDAMKQARDFVDELTNKQGQNVTNSDRTVQKSA